MNEHTPTPWVADPDDRHGYEWNIHILDQRGDRICFMTSDGPAEENAAFIVKAVNSHDALVKALQFIADGYDNQDVNHVDFRVKAYQVAIEVLELVGSPGHE